MPEPKALTELSLTDLWAGVKVSSDPWGDLQEAYVETVKKFLEHAFEEELLEQLCVGWYGRNPDRVDYRNGYRTRCLVTRLGVIKNLRVPRSRDGVYKTRILPKYARYESSVEDLVRDAFVAGVSTRRVGEVLEPMLGAGVSAGTVSRIAKTLDAAVREFHQRRLADDVVYLFLDGVYHKLKGVAAVQRKVVLMIYAVRESGERELVSFCLASSESEQEWERALSDVHRRGLEGTKLRLIVTDGGSGLHGALATVYPHVPRQRCWVHKLRNAMSKLPARHREECLKDLRPVYLAENMREARKLYREWAKKWQPLVPKVVECLDRDIDDLLSFMREPHDRARMLRTTNVIERAFREVRRRTNPMSCFNDQASCERIVYSVVAHQNARWKDHPLPHCTHNY